jgi:hypothetical protein
MTEKISAIRNPLTVIAIFAGIAEVSGSVVLPFVHQEHQGLYVQFLIWFPTYLVTLFFLVLLFKHKVFYAPSDFRDDKSFMDLVQPSSAADRIKRINAEIQEEVRQKPPRTAGELTTPDAQREARKDLSEIRSRYLAAEEMVIGLLSKELGYTFDRNTQFGTKEASYPFDASIIRDGKLYTVEVKMIRSPLSVQSMVRGSLEKIAQFWNSLPEQAKKSFHLTLAVVLDSGAARAKEVVQARLRQLTPLFPFLSSVRVFTYDEIQKLTEET